MGDSFRLPLIPVFFSYTAGLFLGSFGFPVPSQASLLTLSGLLAGWFFFVAVKKVLWGSCTGLILFFLLGIFSIQTYLIPPLPSHHVSRFIGAEPLALEGSVDRPPDRTPEGTQLLIRSRNVIVADRHIRHYLEQDTYVLSDGWNVVYVEELPLDVVSDHDTSAMSMKTMLAVKVVPLQEYEYSADTYVVAVISDNGTVTQYH